MDMIYGQNTTEDVAVITNAGILMKYDADKVSCKNAKTKK